MKKDLTDILKQRSTKADDVNQILNQCLHFKNQAEDQRTLKVQQENTADLYYSAQLPGATIEDKDKQKDNCNGDDRFISEFVYPYVFNQVKRVLPQMLDSLTNSDGLIASFRSGGFRKDSDLEKLIEYNVNKIFMRQLNGKSILEKVIHNVLSKASGIVKVYVEEKQLGDSIYLNDWVELASLAQQLKDGWELNPPSAFNDQTKRKGESRGFSWKTTKAQVVDPQTQQIIEQDEIWIKGRVKLLKDTSQIKVEAVETKDIWCDTSYGEDFSKARAITHRIYTTRGEAELMGFDPEKLKDAEIDCNEDLRLPELYFSPGMYMAPDLAGNTLLDNNAGSIDNKEQKISYYETYINSSLLSKNGEVRKYQVVHTSNDVLSIQEIKRFPFVHGKCEPVQGQFWGKSLYDIGKSYQDALTTFIRVQMQVGKKAAYPQYIGVKGQYDRASAQLLHKPGAIVEVQAAGGLSIISQPDLTQTFFQAFNALKESSIETMQAAGGAADIEAGVSQVAAATVAMSIYQDAQRGMILAHNLSSTLIVPLVELIYEIIKDEEWPLETEDGQQITGAELPEHYEWVVDAHTAGDDYSQVMQMASIAQFVGAMSQTPSEVVSSQNIYEMAKVMCEKYDLDYTKFLTDPQTLMTPEAQQKQAEQEALQSEAAKVQLETAKVLMRQEAAKTWKTEVEAQTLLENSAHSRQIDQVNAANAAAKIVADAQGKQGANQVKAEEVKVKNKAVDNETNLAVLKHATDITMPQINGVK